MGTDIHIIGTQETPPAGGRQRRDPGEASDYIWILKLRLRNAMQELDSYKNGNKYRQLREEYESIIRQKDREIDGLKKEVREARGEARKIRKMWNEVLDDMESENKREVEGLRKQLEETEARAARAENESAAMHEKNRELNKKYYEVGARLEEELEKNKKLTAQVNKDFQNSSIPSSQQGAGRKKIPNSREKSGLKPGGQCGHEGHRLTQQKPTETHRLKDPEEYVNNPDYYATGEVVKRQRIVLNIGVQVIEYTANVFRSRSTGSRVHAEFPPGFETDISYDASVKATAFLLNNECNVSVGKTRRFLREVSGGAINLSEATISGLPGEFSSKTEEEKNEQIEQLMTSPVLNVDFTNANVNGQSKQVLIAASPSKGVKMYFARDNKGHKGIKGTPIENYVGTLVHDHDTTFYSYGSGHQECMQHNGRYLTGSEQNEDGFTWNKSMHDLVRRMLHYRKTLGDSPLDPEYVASLEKEYDEILETARKEYDDEPPGDGGYRDGYNLYVRLRDYKESELRFLHDKNVPPDNSLAERCARQFKRKQKQVMAFRSNSGFVYFCDSLGTIQSIKDTGGELYNSIVKIFARKKPAKKEVNKEIA